MSSHKWNNVGYKQEKLLILIHTQKHCLINIMGFMALLITGMLVFLCIFCSGRKEVWSWMRVRQYTCLEVLSICGVSLVQSLWYKMQIYMVEVWVIIYVKKYRKHQMKNSVQWKIITNTSEEPDCPTEHRNWQVKDFFY